MLLNFDIVMGQLSQLLSWHDLPTLIFLLCQQLYKLPPKSICLFSANTKLFKLHVTPYVHFHNRWHIRSTYVFELWVLNECVSPWFQDRDIRIYVHEYMSYLDQPWSVLEVHVRYPETPRAVFEIHFEWALRIWWRKGNKFFRLFLKFFFTGSAFLSFMCLSKSHQFWPFRKRNKSLVPAGTRIPDRHYTGSRHRSRYTVIKKKNK